MGKFNTRQGLSSLANSDITGQFGIYGGGASIPLLVDGATNRLLTLSDTNSGSVFYVQDADGTRLFDITTTGIEVGGNYTLPLTDGTASQYLSTDGSGAVTWENLPDTGITTVEIHNNTGSVLSKGAPVYVTGTHASGKPTVALTDADGTGTYPAIGLVSADIANGADGTVVAGGTLANWDTSAYTAGDALYIDTTAGALTSTRPTAETAKVQKVAVVTRSHASSGSVIVMGAGRTNDIPNDVSILDLADTPSTYGTNGQVLTTDGSGAVSFEDPNNVVASTRFIEGTNTEAVTKGDPVYVSGESGGKPEFSKCDANDDPFNPAVGLVTDTHGTAGSDIIVQTFGVMDGLNTVSYTAGDTLYVASGGGFDDTTYASAGRTQVGFVLTSHVSAGEIYINTTNMDENRFTLDYVTDRGTTTTNSIGVSAVTATNTNDGSGIVTGMTLFRDSATPADGDALMRLSFNGNTSTGTPLTYASIWGIADTVTSGSEVGRLRFRTYNGASFWDTGLEVHEGTISIGDTDPYTMPGADGSANQVLTTDGSGTVTWADAGGSSTLNEVLTEGNTSTQDAQFGGVTVSQSDTGSSFISVNSIADGSDWPALAITSTTASAATNDYIGSISWFGQNDAAQNVNYGSIGMQTVSVTDGDEDGAINFNVMGDGTLSEVLELRGTGITARKSTTVVGSLETQTTSTLKGFEAISTDDTGADWNAFAMTRYTTSPADNDIVGSFRFNQLNDVTSPVAFASFQAIATDVTSTTEDGELIISTVANGSDTEGLRVTGGTIKVAGAFTLPTADGSANQVLQTNGSGTVSWASAPAPSDIADIGNVTVSSPSTNQVLVWNGVASEWQNNSVPVPTLAEVTASGASTSTTVTFASILQTGSTLNVATSGNHYAQLRATTLEVGTSATEQYEFPASDGNAGEVLTTDGSGALSFGKARSMTFSNSGVHQLTTSTDTFYRLCAATTAPNSTYWSRTTSSTAPTSLTRTAQYSKAGHVIPVDITDAVVNCTVSSSISASASSDSAATEYNGDTISYYLYKWADGSTATQIATWTDTFNGGVSYAEEQSSATEFTLTASAGDAIFVVARCLEQATATRYWSMQYTIDIQY